MDLNFNSAKKEKAKEQSNADNDIIEETRSLVININRRLNKIEQSSQKTSISMSERDDGWDSQITLFANELEVLTSELKEIESRTSKNLKLMGKIINRFKNASKKTDYNETLKKLDNWNVDQFVTKNSFHKILLTEIQRRL